VLKVQAIIREERLEAVVERLLAIGIRGLTMTPAKGMGRSGGHSIFRGSAYRVDFVSKVLLEWYGADDEADVVTRAIVQRAATGKIGDGKIFFQRVEEAVRIRTGERGLAAF
jgi:nitrogen regulatory protein P-II 1